MGTSSSSGGPGHGVPMVPPWVPDLPSPDEVPLGTDSEGEDAAGSGDQQSTSPPAQPGTPVPVAPAGRFKGARLALGRFAGTADNRGMRRGLAHYVRSGYGGVGTATRRFAGTAQTAGVLYGALSSAGRAETALPGVDIDAAVLSGRTADEVTYAVVEAVRPIDGTQDADASRASIKNALSELLTRFPDAMLLELTEDQKFFVVERYVALDVYHRIHLDIGKTIQDRAPTAKACLARLKEVKEYIKETVSAAFRRLDRASALTSRQVAKLAQRALKETFTVFESYLQ